MGGSWTPPSAGKGVTGTVSAGLKFDIPGLQQFRSELGSLKTTITQLTQAFKDLSKAPKGFADELTRANAQMRIFRSQSGAGSGVSGTGAVSGGMAGGSAQFTQVAGGSQGGTMGFGLGGLQGMFGRGGGGGSPPGGGGGFGGGGGGGGGAAAAASIAESIGKVLSAATTAAVNHMNTRTQQVQAYDPALSSLQGYLGQNRVQLQHQLARGQQLPAKDAGHGSGHGRGHEPVGLHQGRLRAPPSVLRLCVRSVPCSR